MKKWMMLLVAVASIVLPLELVQARGGRGRGGGYSGRSGGMGGKSGRRTNKKKDRQAMLRRADAENRDGLIRDVLSDTR